MTLMGRVYRNIGLYNDSRRLLEQAVEILETELGREHPDLADSLDQLGQLLWKAGDFNAAQVMMNRTLQIRERELGSEHPAVASSLNDIATLLWQKGDYAGARKLYEQLAGKNREAWLREEMEVLSNPATYNLEPKDSWKRLKLRSSSRRHLGVLMEVATWREQAAQKQDVPRNRILKDDAIHEIVAQRPTSQQELKQLRLVSKNLAQSSRGESLILAVKRGKQISKDALPVLAASRISSQRNGSLIDLLKVLLKLQCEQHGVAQKLVANVQDLEAIAADDTARVPAMSGWRYNIFGELAVKLKRREIAIGMGRNGAKVIPISEG